MEFGLLGHDALWVLDEVQLMGVGLATTAAMEAFRVMDAPKALRPVYSWWMSATLRDDWLARSVDFAPRLSELARIEIPSGERAGSLWAAKKPLEIVSIPEASDPKRTSMAARVVEAHLASDRGVTLAVVNTVEGACALHAAVVEKLAKAGEPVEVRLVHSRFRGSERAGWRDAFLNRGACGPKANRIIVATQVVEAGVDISADVLITDLAPWPSLVQRFGRCARYGGQGRVVVISRFHDETSLSLLKGKDSREKADEKTARPYDLGPLVAAKEALAELTDVGLLSLEQLAEQLPQATLARLFPYEPLHVLTRRELDDLFDTGPDLTGADLDVSRFIREGEERDVLVWWSPVGRDDSPSSDLVPTRDALCPVRVDLAQAWLLKGADGKRPRAWVWDYLAGSYRPVRRGHLYPGQTILVDAASGGYEIETGFTGKPSAVSVPTSAGAMAPSAALRAEMAQDRDDLTGADAYKTIATHGGEAAGEAVSLCRAAALSGALERVVALAARLHDLGKAHPVFVAAIADKGDHASRSDLAKAPAGAWHIGREIFSRAPSCGKRPGFRHELASMLALLEILSSAAPEHEAFHGRDAAEVERAPAVSEDGLSRELATLSGAELDLLFYLIVAHHGKVRGSLQATPHDQDFLDHDGRGLPLRGVREGDAVPAVAVALVDRAPRETSEVTLLPGATLHLDPAAIGLSKRYGRSWIDRVARLRRHYGPFTLAYLETLLRVADVRASRLTTTDPLLGAPR